MFFKMIKGGLVRIVATEAEKTRWENLGYKCADAGSAQSKVPADPLAVLEVDELKEFAAERGVDIGNATSKSGILKKIRDAVPFVPDNG